jgi:hypothetical protein
MGRAARSPTPAFPSCLPLLFGLCGASACGSDPVYVLGRLPGTGGENDSGISAGGSTGTGGSAGAGGVLGAAGIGGAGGVQPEDGSPGDGGCALPAPDRDYAFTGTGTDVVDRRGGPPGVILGGAALAGSGELNLDGDDDYVDLPNGILTGLDEVTVVVWLRYLGGAAYTRIFDFGIGSDGEDPAEGLNTTGRTYLAATPWTGFRPDELAALIKGRDSGGEIPAPTDVELDDALHMVSVSASLETLDLFLDGALIGRVRSAVPLSSIENVNNWLGRSQYDQDPYLHAAYAGVQVYGRALDECAIQALHARGPAAP